MSVTASSLTAINAAPSSPDALWALGCLLTPDWSGGVSLTTTWATEIIGARSSAEQRRGLASRPTRILSFSVATQEHRQSWLLQQLIRRQAIARSLVPIYPDGLDLHAPMTDAQIVPAKTGDRRYYVGARVVIAEFADSVERPIFAVGIISAVTASQITLTAGLPRLFGRGARIYPLIECDIVTDGAFGLTTRQTGIAGLTAREVAGKSALPPLRTYGSHGLPTYAGLPVWVPPLNFAEGRPALSYQGQFRSERLGRGIIYERSGPRPIARASGTARGINRSASLSVPRLFDAMAGSLGAMIVVDISSAPPVIASAGNAVIFDAIGSTLDWSAVPYLAAVLPDGSATIASIVNVTRGSGTDQLTLSGNLPPQNTVARYAPARVCRFASDELTERWASVESASVEWSVVELSRETVAVLE